MTQTKYGIIKQGKPQFPVRELLVVPHGDGDLTVSYPVFGPNTYKGNMKNMGESHSHPEIGDKISFRPASTSESISAAAYEFETMAKPQIFDPRWLQAGYIVRTQDGVYVNPPKDAHGVITDETFLKSLLTSDKKVNGIYLLNYDFGFAPYESFERGVQDCDTFARGGLARTLEHTSEKIAVNLREIASPKFYKRGVDVWGFDKVNQPVLKVASLDSYRYFVGNRLGVGGDLWGDGSGGYAFGVRP